MFKKLKGTSIYSCSNGEVVALEEVPDPVFSQKLMGEGVAIKSSDGVFRAPVDGTITLISPTKHAFGMTSDSGVELLVHIGIDTVNLNGEGFKVVAQAETFVKKGTPIIEADLDLISSKGIPTVTPMIILSGESKIKDKLFKTVVDSNDVIITVK